VIAAASSMNSETFFIAQIGRTVGLHGDLKLNLHTDFPEQFQPGALFASDRGELEIAAYNSERGLIRIVGYASMESAKQLTNAKLYSTLEKTREQVTLAEGEHFWFEIIGASVIENGVTLGVVVDIERLTDADYLDVKTDEKMVENGCPKSFLIPYIPRYIVSVDSTEKTIDVIDAHAILEAS